MYNRVIWGTSPDEYRAFAWRAVHSADSVWLLDVGCGTLLFAAPTPTPTPRTARWWRWTRLWACRVARARLAEVSAGAATHVIFLRADLLDLPLRPAAFQTLLSMRMLHLFGTLEPMVVAMHRTVAPGGGLHLFTLVRGRPLGDRYTALLHRAGELNAPRTAIELEHVLVRTLPNLTLFSSGNMACATARA